MIMNYNQLVDHNKDFWAAFVDLKTVGWKSYSKSLNAYTFNFFKQQLDAIDAAVEKSSDIMKGEFRGE